VSREDNKRFPSREANALAREERERDGHKVLGCILRVIIHECCLSFLYYSTHRVEAAGTHGCGLLDIYLTTVRVEYPYGFNNYIVNHHD